MGSIGANEIMNCETASLSPSSSSSSPVPGEDVMYVALGKDEKESETMLTWALKNLNGVKRICVLHTFISLLREYPQRVMGGKFPINLVDKKEVDAYHEKERNDMNKILDKYTRTCNRVAKVQADKLWIETDSVDKGLVQLISENRVKWLVMGAAANKFYSKKMTKLKSKKAIHVFKEAPFCHISFICKGNLICSRKMDLDRADQIGQLLQFQRSPTTENTLPPKCHSVTEETRGILSFENLVRERRRVKSDLSVPTNGVREESPQISFNQERREYSVMSSPSVVSRLSTRSCAEVSENITLSPFVRIESNEFGLHPSPNFQKKSVDHRHSSVSSYSIENDAKDELYDRVEQLVAEAESSRKDAYEESMRRRKAEKDVIRAIRRANASEAMYTGELKHRQEIEEALARVKEESEKLNWKLDELTEELRIAEEDKISLEQQVVDSDKTAQELEQKMYSAVELLQKYKKERDDLQINYDNALRVLEEMRSRQSEEASTSTVSQFFCEFSFSEIEKATNSFSKASKIGEGGYGFIYRGNLRHTEIAVKMLKADSSQGHLEFQQEVDILSKLRHSNIITLIGACPESFALVYEYLSNGSLEDRLKCKNNAPPLSWKTRISMATELCSALIFLHHCSPHGIVHGDLKPANILLDDNLTTKLSDFGICRKLPDIKHLGDTTRCLRTIPKGTFVYLDPVFLTTGEITTKSDVYAFGIILLQLLTGRPASKVTDEVREALDRGNVMDLLDPTPGDWPFVQARQLAHVAVRCCDKERSLRPDLVSEVWRLLEPIKVSSGVSTSIHSDQRCRVPSYFVCPIFQEVMQDPVVAADGFTYEAEAIIGWLESGNDNSPMTNLKLPHGNVVPNHALRSAIREWMQ